MLPPPAGAAADKALVESGAKVFERVCAACHQADGQGVGNVFPPLRDSDYLRADLDRAISSIINGLSGPIVVNGVEYNTAMPPMAYLSDEEVASVLTFVLEEWNGGGGVTVEQVASVRAGNLARHPVGSEEQHAYEGTPSAIPIRRDPRHDRIGRARRWRRPNSIGRRRSTSSVAPAATAYCARAPPASRSPSTSPARRGPTT